MLDEREGPFLMMKSIEPSIVNRLVAVAAIAAAGPLLTFYLPFGTPALVFAGIR